MVGGFVAVAVVAAVVVAVVVVEVVVVAAVAGGWKSWKHFRTNDETE